MTKKFGFTLIELLVVISYLLLGGLGLAVGGQFNKALKRWLDQKGKVEYKEVCSESTKLYARKTESNYQAMTQLT